ERRRQPGLEREQPSVPAHEPGHLLERRARRVEPLVEQPPSRLERGPERRELALHPAGGDGGHDPAAGEEVERRQLLQRDERVPLRDDERRHAELEPARVRREEAERDERLGDRAVDRRVLRRHDEVVGDPAAVEARLLGRDRAPRQPVGVEPVAVVREDEAEVPKGHGKTVAPLAASLSSATLEGMRLLAALVLPPLLAVCFAYTAERVVGGPPPPQLRAEGLVWGKRTFATRADFARWLQAHGRNYD